MNYRDVHAIIYYNVHTRVHDQTSFNDIYSGGQKKNDKMWKSNRNRLAVAFVLQAANGGAQGVFEDATLEYKSVFLQFSWFELSQSIHPQQKSNEKCTMRD